MDCCVNHVHDGLKNYSEIKTSQGDSINDIYRLVHKFDTFRLYFHSLKSIFI